MKVLGCVGKFQVKIDAKVSFFMQSQIPRMSLVETTIFEECKKFPVKFGTEKSNGVVFLRNCCR